MIDGLFRLEAWHARRRAGEWKRHHGITIATLDNPGWRLRIDARGSDQRERPFAPISVATSDLDWLECRVYDRIIEDAGGPDKPALIPRAFRDWCKTSP